MVALLAFAHSGSARMILTFFFLSSAVSGRPWVAFALAASFRASTNVPLRMLHGTSFRPRYLYASTVW
jgi:hypothetical protein